LEQERIMAVWSVDLGIGDRDAIVQQRTDDFARIGRGKPPIRSEGSEKERGLHVGQRARQVSCVCLGWIEIVQRAGQQKIGVGVEIARELLALIAQIRLDFELDIVTIAKCAAVLWRTL